MLQREGKLVHVVGDYARMNDPGIVLHKFQQHDRTRLVMFMVEKLIFILLTISDLLFVMRERLFTSERSRKVRNVAMIFLTSFLCLFRRSLKFQDKNKSKTQNYSDSTKIPLISVGIMGEEKGTERRNQRKIFGQSPKYS